MRQCCCIFAFFLCFFIFASSKDSESLYIRSILFKRHHLRTDLNEYHIKTLKNINLRGQNIKLPGLALCSLKKLDKKKSDREFFIKSIGAAVEWVNQRILEHRSLVLEVRKKIFQRIPLSNKEKYQFRLICKFYRSKDITELLKRVAPLPVSLAIAQAALESGFGQAKYMYDKNAFFGIMKNSKSLYAFETVIDSVIAYAKALNVNRAYRDFRTRRAAMIANNQVVEGEKLIPYLARYSSRVDYGDRVQRVMNSNNLKRFDYKIESSI